jgi:hypothetical protein
MSGERAECQAQGTPLDIGCGVSGLKGDTLLTLGPYAAFFSAL